MMVLLVVAVVIVLGLAAYAAYLLLQVKKQQREQGEKLAELDAFVLDQKEKRVASIRILAQGVLDDQLSHTEAAVRITALLDVLGQGAPARQEHAALYKLTDETLHIPRMADWQALSKADQKRLEKDRLNSEAKYKDFVLASAKTLVSYQINGDVK
ncbi:DUF2489 domain-containing protein [Simiduia curdlanivorans]|uniref:DUF2489 domain-containing protein n=1 Tax=Simiduia curdlanivorans TaxID=1492769 RepID=A0ABV8V7T1_9GAMM|nr:DUF2489 domain-containing protein [Simiduia curdlanivorans]MDN3639711.1 DUF2489 domain-containing protein [Simiduia curdlanivorans]